MTECLPGIVEPNQEAQQLATDFAFTEGPLWHPDGYWLFVDLRREPPVIHRMSPAGGTPEIIRERSGGTNGMTLDLQGRLLMCEGDNRRIACMESDGTINVVAGPMGRQAVPPAQRPSSAAATGVSTSPIPAAASQRRSRKSNGPAPSTASLRTARLICPPTTSTSPTALRSLPMNRCCTCPTPASSANGPTSIGTVRSNRTSSSRLMTWQPTVH